MVNLAASNRKWLTVVLLAALSHFGSQSLRGASLGDSAPHRCAGCATGACTPSTTTYGYYRSIWRRWPGTLAAGHLVTGAPPADAPDVEVPEPIDETRYRKRSRSDAPLEEGKRGRPADSGTPSTPGGTTPQVDPFRTVPESEAPDFDLLGPPDADRDGAGEGPLGGDIEDEPLFDTPFDLGPAEDDLQPRPESGREPEMPDFEDPSSDLDLPFSSRSPGPAQRLSTDFTTPGNRQDGGAASVPFGKSAQDPALGVDPNANVIPKPLIDGLVSSPIPVDILFPPPSKNRRAGASQVKQASYETNSEELAESADVSNRNPLRGKLRRDAFAKSPRESEAKVDSLPQQAEVATSVRPSISEVIQTPKPTPQQPPSQPKLRKNPLR